MDGLNTRSTNTIWRTAAILEKLKKNHHDVVAGAFGVLLVLSSVMIDLAYFAVSACFTEHVHAAAEDLYLFGQ